MPPAADDVASQAPRRSPATTALLVGAVAFVLFMAIELLIYGKGIGRALWISALAGVVLFAVALVYQRAVARNSRR